MNITWSEAKNSKDQASLNVLEHWDGANTNIYVTLVIFIVLKVGMHPQSIAVLAHLLLQHQSSSVIVCKFCGLMGGMWEGEMKQL